MKYTIRRSRRARTLGLSVYPDGRIVLTMPWKGSQRAARQFIRDKTDWINLSLEKIGSRQNGFYKGRKIVPKDYTDYFKYKDPAEQAIKSRVLFLNKFYGFNFNKIYVKNQKTVWGSCSSKRNLNFNYKIIFFPKHLRDYVIVHEICHLKELNHSKSFWELVGKLVPGYKECRREVRSLVLD